STVRADHMLVSSRVAVHMHKWRPLPRQRRSGRLLCSGVECSSSWLKLLQLLLTHALTGATNLPPGVTSAGLPSHASQRLCDPSQSSLELRCGEAGAEADMAIQAEMGAWHHQNALLDAQPLGEVLGG